MTKYSTLSLSIILIFHLETSCQNVTGIVGEWGLALVQEKGGEKIAIECPDFLIFSNDNRYKILNDCEWQLKNEDGIVEVGDWSLDSNSMLLTLSNREFLNAKDSQYAFHGRATKLTIVIQAISEDELLACIDNGFDCTIERYQRRK